MFSCIVRMTGTAVGSAVLGAGSTVQARIRYTEISIYKIYGSIFRGKIVNTHVHPFSIFFCYHCIVLNFVENQNFTNVWNRQICAVLGKWLVSLFPLHVNIWNIITTFKRLKYTSMVFKRNCKCFLFMNSLSISFVPVY